MGQCASVPRVVMFSGPTCLYPVVDGDWHLVKFHKSRKARADQPVKSDGSTSSNDAPSKGALHTKTDAIGTQPDEADLAPNVVTNPETDLILNMLDPENGPAAGQPYQVHFLGPPRPPCEEERLATVMAIGKIQDNFQPDPEINTILKLVASIFKAPAALCALFDAKRVFVSEQEGNVIPCGEFPWRWTLCGWSMAFKNPQVLVIQDTLQDSRFRNNEKVTIFPKVRFYCGAPLVASNGHRLGTLCFADVKPRKFDMASCIMMNNLSELVVRQLEKDLALKLKERDNQLLMQTYKHLQRAVDSYEHCVVLVDTTEDGWRVVYSNNSWTRVTGLPRESLVGCLLRDVLEATDGTQLPSAELRKAVAHLKSHKVEMARSKDPSITKTFKLSFKPAGRNMIDSNTVPMGVPSFLSPDGAEEDVAHKFYFMTLYPPGVIVPSSNGTGSGILAPVGVDLSGSDTSSTDGGVLPGLELAHLLGRGSWGWVYYGTWYGTPVAVKVIDDDGKSAGDSNPCCVHANREAVLARELRHPCIVATLTYTTRMVPCVRPSGASDYQCSLPRAVVRELTDEPEKGQGEDSEGGANVAHHAWAVIEAGPDVQDHAGEEAMETEMANACRVKADGWVIDESAAVNAKGAKHVMDTSDLPGGNDSSAIIESDSFNSQASSMMQQTWMVMEFCDRGCLQDAIDRGWLRTERDCLHSAPFMPAVIATALEVAGAMAYLHGHEIVHGDLTGWNVMLSSAGQGGAEGGRGFVAKVADFGMSRSLSARVMQTRNYGTITHMPPELLMSGTMSKAVDVWSFGVLLWQIVTGSRPWSGLTHAQVIFKVVNERQQLMWTPDVPDDFVALGRECLAYDMSLRPSFTDIVARLEAMREALSA